MKDGFHSASVAGRVLSLGLLVLATAPMLSSCGGGSSRDATPQQQGPYISASLISFPTGSVPTGFVPSGFNSSASVEVLDSSTGASITSASVSMNGVALVYNATNADYEGNLTVAPGDSVVLNVSVGGNTYSVSGTQFNSYPAISAPVAGATWSLSLDNLVSWSGGTPATNAFHAVAVMDAADPNNSIIYPANIPLVLPTSTTSTTVPAYKLTAGSRLAIVGIATNIDMPSAYSGSGILIGGFNYAPVTVVDSSIVTLQSIAVTPADQPMAKGKTLQLAANGTYSNNSTSDATLQSSWSSSDPNTATVSPTGQVTATGVGSATITATSGSIVGSTTVTVLAGFNPATKYADPSNVLLGDTVVGDLNGDGLKDVAVLEGSYSATRILIYFQNAGRTFNAPQGVTTDLNVMGIAIGDVNNDGLMDLVASGNSTTATSGSLGRIAVFLQDSTTHALGAPQEYVLSANYVGPLTIADLNGDSLPDIVSAGTGSGANGIISVLVQGSGGTFGPEVTYIVAPVVLGGEIHVADMNNDGHNDIVLQSGNKQLAVIKQTAAGDFNSTPDFYAVQTSYWPSFNSFGLADLNGDGRTDIVVADLTGYLNVFYQNTSGVLVGPTIVGTYYGASEVKTADLDGDGLNDIVLLDGGNEIRLLYQASNHSFYQINPSIIPNPLVYVLPTNSTGGTAVHQAMFISDVTGDGLLDIVTSWSNEGIFVLPRMP